MPSAETSIPLWERPPKTTYGLDWAHLSVIDISRFDEPGEKLRLAEQLREAIHKDGFFSVIGTGFTEEEVVCIEALHWHIVAKKKKSSELINLVLLV